MQLVFLNTLPQAHHLTVLRAPSASIEDQKWRKLWTEEVEGVVDESCGRSSGSGGSCGRSHATVCQEERLVLTIHGGFTTSSSGAKKGLHGSVSSVSSVSSSPRPRTSPRYRSITSRLSVLVVSASLPPFVSIRSDSGSKFGRSLTHSYSEGLVPSVFTLGRLDAAVVRVDSSTV